MQLYRSRAMDYSSQFTDHPLRRIETRDLAPNFGAGSPRPTGYGSRETGYGQCGFTLIETIMSIVIIAISCERQPPIGSFTVLEKAVTNSQRR